MAAGDPTGNDLVSGTTDGDTLPEPWPPTEPEEREISFGAGTELTSGVTYAVVVRAPDASNSSDAGLWQMVADGTGIGGSGTIALYYSTNGGSTWSSQAPAKVWFKTYAGAALRDHCTFDYEGSGAWLYGSAYWSAMTFTASSTYTITKIKLRLYRVAGATPGTITVGIRATVGAPEKPINPTPSDTADDVTLDQQTITWEDGGNATSYNVYYGDTSGDLTLVSEGQAGLSYTIWDTTLGSPFDYLITRYWRVDAVNASGTTTGDEWSFVTIDFDQLQVSYRLISGGSGNGPYDDPPGTQGTDWEYTGLNNMITVRRLVVAANSKIWYESI